jgi:DNA-binding transcriptional MerR regulator
MKTYTITEMARIVKIPPSTATYYKDRHPDFFNSIGSGRRTRYTPEALEALKLIVEMANRKASKEDIEEALSQTGNRNIEVQQDSNNSLTTEYQQSLQPVKFMNLLNKLVDQKNQIETLQKDVNMLKEYINKNRLTWWQKLLKRGDNE